MPAPLPMPKVATPSLRLGIAMNHAESSLAGWLVPPHGTCCAGEAGHSKVALRFSVDAQVTRCSVDAQATKCSGTGLVAATELAAIAMAASDVVIAAASRGDCCCCFYSSELPAQLAAR